MTEVGQLLSKEKQVNKIFAQIAGVPDPKTRVAMLGTGIAEPGDLLFFITHYPDEQSLYDNRPRARRASFYRRCYGFAEDDFDEWHVAVYLMGRKRKNHERINLWMLHSSPRSLRETDGVRIQHVSRTALINKPPASQTRMEVLQFKGISKDQRKKITDHASTMVGSKFDYSISRHALLTLVLGLPNLLHDQSSFACQSLVVSAYSAAGIWFPHPYKSFPYWNIGRLLGHPLGHSRDGVNPRYPYIMDHHIYRDPRLEVRATVHQNLSANELHFETGNLEKYSWNPTLRNRYGIENLNCGTSSVSFRRPDTA